MAKPSLTSQNIPVEPVAVSTEPVIDYNKGVYRHIPSGLLYEVGIVPDDARGRTHKARVPAQDNGHPGFFWEGTRQEFTAVFEKS